MCDASTANSFLCKQCQAAITHAQTSITNFNASAAFCLAQGFDSPAYNQTSIRDQNIRALLSVLKAFIVMDASCESGVRLAALLCLHLPASTPCLHHLLMHRPAERGAAAARLLCRWAPWLAC